MITNAKDTTISQATSHLPNVSTPVTKWFLNLEYIFITKTIVNGRVQETEELKNFQGVVQNLSSRELMLKPEAQRAWTWKMIHSLPSLQLDVDDIIKYNSIKYRVMNMKDFSEYGYISYHIVEDYN